MGNIQCVQWKPANIMQRTPVSKIAHGISTTTRHYQWRKRVQSWKSMESQEIRM